LRTLAGELRPPTLAPYGLEKAIRAHSENFQSLHPDLRLHLELAPDGQRLSEQMRLALFRIYQTAMVNIARHSQATRAIVRLELDETDVTLEIEDNGIGFQVPDRWIELARKGHLGLVSASERAEAIGGRLQVSSKPNGGTILRVQASR
jgi:signal transduction histidine kinase